MESLKKVIYAGLGAIIVTKDKVKEALKDLVEQGKITAEEAEKYADKISKQAKKEFETMRKSVSETVAEKMEKVHFATKKEFDQLKSRVEAIEDKLGKTSNKAKKE